MSARTHWGWSVLAILSLFCTTVGLVYVSVSISLVGGYVAALWPVNAIVLSLIATQPRHRWALILLVVYSADALTNTLLMGSRWPLALGLAATNTMEVALASWLLFRDQRRFDVSSVSDLGRFVLVAVLVAPLLASSVAALLIPSSRPYADVLLRWFSSDALGMLVFAPVLLAVLVPDRRRVRRGWLELTLSATIVLSMLLAVFAQSSVSLLYCVPPVLTLATFRLGIRGAASAILLTAIAAIWATVNELGPFHQAQGGTLERLYMLQGFVAFVSLTTLPIAAALGRAESLLLEIRQVNGALAQAREEADHARLEAESARSEALDYARRYQDLADNATDIVLRFDRDGLISYASPAVSMLGLTPDQAVGQTTVSLLGAANAGEAMTELRQLFDLDQDGSEDANRHEYRVALPDGGRIWLESHSKVLRNEHGQPVEAVSLFRDHTARHQLEESLRAARQSAERAAAVKSEFLANMSHELRTPLNSIVGFSQLLQGTAGLTPVQRRYLDVVSSSSRNLLAIINDLLDFSSLEAGGLRLEIQPFSFGTLVEQAVESLRIQAEDKNLALSMVLDERLAARHVGDEGRLRQILLNLMSNALKFTEAGRVDVVVRVVDQRAGEQTLAVLVRDTGIGIPAEDVDRLFTRFEQLDASVSRRFGGAGLGLAIVRLLLDRMGGRIHVESVQNCGSSFHFTLTLPIAAAESAPAPVAAARNQPLGPRHLLVVDDVDLNRELARAMLATAGHEVDVASDGEEALALIAKQRYDLIFMDVRMPVMDGLEATRRLRSQPGGATVPVVAMTAQTLPEQIRACRDAGMDDHLLKPLAPGSLDEMVRKWAQGSVLSRHRGPVDQTRAKLRERFLQRCTEDLEALPGLWEDAAGLRDRVHKLAGTAAMFGESEIGERASLIDRSLASGEAVERGDFDALIEALSTAVERVRATPDR